MCDIVSFALNRHRKRERKNIITTGQNKRSRVRRLSKWNMPTMSRRSSRPALSYQSQRKSESNLKPAACNWKQAGCNSKPAASSLRPLAEQARPRAPVEVRALHQLRNHRPSNTNMTSISMTNPNRDQLIALVAIFAAGFIAGCATNPPPLPPNNPADPEVHGSSRRPRNLLAPDETTLAIEKQLSATQADAESAEKMEHNMQNMPDMQHGEIQHGKMKMG